MEKKTDIEQEVGKEVTRRNYLAAAATGAAVLAAGALAGPAQAQKGQPPGPDVRVINKPSEPVPVTQQGAVQIDTSSPLSVQIDTSSPLPVRDVNYRTQQHVQFTLFEPGVNTYTVPAGKEFVIEFVSGSFALNPSDPVGHAFFGIRVSGGGGPDIRHELAPVVTDFLDGAPVGHIFAVSQMCRIYAGPGAQVRFEGGVLHSGTVSGNLIDTP